MKLIIEALGPEKFGLRNLLAEAKVHTTWVKAAVAYAHGNPELIQFCKDSRIPLTFYGRHDGTVPVDPGILRKFVDDPSIQFTARLVTQGFHAKVIWWGGFGVYIGSANLTEKAWSGNIECGIFLTEDDIEENGLNEPLEMFFSELTLVSREVTEEIVSELETQKSALRELDNKRFEKIRSFEEKSRIPQRFSYRPSDSRNDAAKRNREEFIEEWDRTLGKLRKLAKEVSENHRPNWIPDGTPSGTQVDQFLHAYYYKWVRGQGLEGHKIPFREVHEKHKANPQKAIQEAYKWWESGNFQEFESEKDMMERSAELRSLLEQNKIPKLTTEEFVFISNNVFAMKDHSYRVSKETFDLPPTAKNTGDERAEFLANYLLRQVAPNGKRVKEILSYVLYEGSTDLLPERIWNASRGDWRIPHFNINTLGEIVGWAMPDVFPPRNGRTNKALYALGYSDLNL